MAELGGWVDVEERAWAKEDSRFLAWVTEDSAVGKREGQRMDGLFSFLAEKLMNVLNTPNWGNLWAITRRDSVGKGH